MRETHTGIGLECQMFGFNRTTGSECCGYVMIPVGYGIAGSKYPVTFPLWVVGSGYVKHP